MRVVSSPRYTVDIGGHVFPTRKFQLAAERLGLPTAEPPEPTRDDLLLVHEPVWTDKVVGCRMTLADEKLMELRVTPEVAAAHRLQVGGTTLAARDALETGVGLHAGGGSHHAFPGRGEGFCVLNDLACAVRKLQAEGRIRRAAVIDLDVHQGNGTAACFAGDPAVFTFSMHQESAYPEPKVPGSLDVGLPDGTGDEAYLEALEAALPRVFRGAPQLVLYQSGVDCADGDLLGGLKLSKRGLAERDRMVLDACRLWKVPVAVTLGGGYSEDLERTVDLHAQTLSIFAGE